MLSEFISSNLVRPPILQATLLWRMIAVPLLAIVDSAEPRLIELALWARLGLVPPVLLLVGLLLLMVRDCKVIIG